MGKLKQIRQRMDEMKQKGLERTLQMQAEKQRQKIKRHQNRPDGAVKAIEEGLICKSSPLDVMKKEYTRRKYERNQRVKKHEH